MSSSTFPRNGLAEQLKTTLSNFMTGELMAYPVDQQRKGIRTFAAGLHAPGALTRAEQYSLFAVANRVEADDLRKVPHAPHLVNYFFYALPAAAEFPLFEEYRERVRLIALDDIPRQTELDMLKIVVAGSTAQFIHVGLPRDLRMALLHEFMWNLEASAYRAFAISLFEACITNDLRRGRELIAGTATVSEYFGSYREADYP